MKRIIAALGFLALLSALLSAPLASRAEDIVRFAPLKPEELTLAQKAWAEELAAMEQIAGTAFISDIAPGTSAVNRAGFRRR